MKWLYVCNENEYKIDEAYKELKLVDWDKKAINIKKGDYIYLYSSVYQSVRYKIIVEEDNINFDELLDDDKYVISEKSVRSRFNKFIRTSLIEKRVSHKLHKDNLKAHGFDFNKYYHGNLAIPEDEIAYIDEIISSEDDKLAVTLAGEYVLNQTIIPVLESIEASDKRKEQAQNVVRALQILPKTGDICRFLLKRINTDIDGKRSQDINDDGFDSFETIIDNFKNKFKDELDRVTNIDDLIDNALYEKPIIQASINNHNRQAKKLRITSKNGKEIGVFLLDYNNDKNINCVIDGGQNIIWIIENNTNQQPNVSSGLNHIIINNLLPIYYAQREEKTGLFKYYGRYKFKEWSNEFPGRAIILEKVDFSLDELKKEEQEINDIKRSVYSVISAEDDGTVIDAIIKARVGQGKFRDRLIIKYDGKCCISGIAIKEILIASHIVPWREATKEQRCDVNNGLLLCAHYDKLFDQNLISFDSDGKIIISKLLSKHVVEQFRLNDVRITINEQMEEYLKIHRSRLK